MPPTFALWRWSTLVNALEWLLPVSGLLILVWTRHMFKEAQDLATALIAHGAVQDTLFWCQFNLVFDLCMHVHGLRSWCSGCDCHEVERLANVPFECFKAGQRLPGLYDKVVTFRAECTSLAVAPRADSYSNWGDLLNHNLDGEWTWAWNYMESLALTLFMFLLHLPFSLARAANVAVLSDARDEHLRAAPKDRHRVAHKFFAEDGLLTSVVDR